MNWNPEEDGLTHINVYSQGKTKLGRHLTNFAHTPFECADGHFESVEGYWYWLRCGDCPEREELRKLHGFKAKQLGRHIRPETNDSSVDFESKIKAALECKLRMAQKGGLLHRNTLPLAHYYVYGKGPNPKVINAGYEWMIEHLEQVCAVMRQEWE